ncbi:hypothetical protein [Synechococcus sp. EJ6-Ellesmere]|uniref:hypothetical protein n=1 Tax=Synechococcus sp. EJ6-Ellesmere TaxID=2823734 RepID=UPI0020CD0696|nr:hypothetical protein [Synechococcus sp. EJ6-Ellesmere]MCP9825862.1 hypothetical protein [Synechococcus sp. EJ6-Ellesmere]
MTTEVIDHYYSRNSASKPMKMIGANLRYRYAFKRMDEAMEEGWLMEAITIQESILSGRLLSCLFSKGINVNPRDSFKSLIDRFRKHVQEEDPQVKALAGRLDEWRVKRNETLHSVCRHIDDPYHEDTIKKFEDKLVDTAREGRALVDDVRNTVERIKRMIKNPGSVS